MTAACSIAVAAPCRGQPRGDTGDERRDRVRDTAAICNRDRAGGDRASGWLVDQIGTGEGHEVGGDAGADRQLGVVGLDSLEGGGQLGDGLAHVPGNDVDQRLGPCRVRLMSSCEAVPLGAAEHVVRLRATSGDELCSSRLEEPLRSPFAVRGELGGAPQIGRGGGRPASLPRSLGRRLQRVRDLLVGAGGRSTEVPRAAVGVGVGVECVGEQGMRASPIGRRRPSSTRQSERGDGGTRRSGRT